MPTRLTNAQVKALKRADERGIIERRGTNGLGQASFDRMMQRLVDANCVTFYVHGGYEITPIGREIVARNPD